MTHSPRPLAQVTVGMKSETLDPEDVTHLVGVSPTRSIRKGELSSKGRVPAPWGVWTYEASSDDVEVAANEVLAAIEPVANQLRQAARKHQAFLSVSIYWAPEYSQGGYSLPCSVVKRLSALGERFDFYFA